MNRTQAKQMRMARSQGKIGLRTIVRLSDSEEETRSQELPGKPIQFSQLPNHGTHYHVYLKFEGFPEVAYYTATVAAPTHIPPAVRRDYASFSANESIRRAMNLPSGKSPAISQIVLEAVI